MRKYELTYFCIIPFKECVLSLAIRLPSVEWSGFECVSVCGLLYEACHFWQFWLRISNIFKYVRAHYGWHWAHYCITLWMQSHNAVTYKSNKNKSDHSKCLVIRINYMENYLPKTASCWGWNNASGHKKQRLLTIVGKIYSYLCFYMFRTK